MRISATPNLYTAQSKKQQAPVQFGGFSKKLTDNKVYNAIESSVIKGCVKLVNTKTMEKLVERTKDYPSIEKKLIPHLLVLGSTILSGFYVMKTLGNKDLDEQKRKTLAINQGLTFVVSTAMAYTFDSWVDKGYTKFIDNFKKANPLLDTLKEAEHQDYLKRWENGLKLAKTIMIMDMVYRFIAPVMVTPVANWCGNKLRENKQAQNLPSVK